MATGVINWSQTAASNATADSSVNWAEGMAPSAVNDSARAMMASVAKYRDDIHGTIATGGTSTAYTVTSYQGSYTATGGVMIAFTPHTTNGATVTLNVDSFGAKPLRSAPAVELPAGVLIQGTPYVATYYSSNGGEWILKGFYGNPYNIPLGGLLAYTGSTAPNSSFVLPYGQAISRTTYATYFSLVGTTFGTGDGSTTFNIIDMRGRVPAGQDNMGGSAASRLTNATSGVDGTTIGAAGGSQSIFLTEAALPTITPAGTVSAPNISIGYGAGGTQGGAGSVSVANGSFANVPGPISQLAVTATASAPTFTGTPFGSGGGHINVQPTIVCPYILRII